MSLANQLNFLGANQSIESAASLANHLKLLMENCSENGPTTKDIETSLAKYQARRQPRANEVVESTNRHVRVFTFRKPVLKLIATYITPLLGDFQANVYVQSRSTTSKGLLLPGVTYALPSLFLCADSEVFQAKSAACRCRTDRVPTYSRSISHWNVSCSKKGSVSPGVLGSC